MNSNEILTEESDLDRNVIQNSGDLLQILKAEDPKELAQQESALIQEFFSKASYLDGKTVDEMLDIVDPDRSLRTISGFKVKKGPAGTIHISVDTQDERRKIIPRGFTCKSRAEYLEPETDNYLGKILTVKESFEDKGVTEEATLGHEQFHAIIRKIVRPHSVVDATGSPSALERKLKESPTVMKSLLEELNINIGEGIPDYQVRTELRAALVRQQELMEELAAHTFDVGITGPKENLTMLDIEEMAEADPEEAKQYFKTWLLNARAYITSQEASLYAAVILGSAVGFKQASRILEQQLSEFQYGNDEDFIERFRTLSYLLPVCDFKFQSIGEVMSFSEAKNILIPPKQQIDREVSKRWGTLSDAPQEFQEVYKNVYVDLDEYVQKVRLLLRGKLDV